MLCKEEIKFKLNQIHPFNKLYNLNYINACRKIFLKLLPSRMTNSSIRKPSCHCTLFKTVLHCTLCTVQSPNQEDLATSFHIIWLVYCNELMGSIHFKLYFHLLRPFKKKLVSKNVFLRLIHIRLAGHSLKDSN